MLRNINKKCLFVFLTMAAWLGACFAEADEFVIHVTKSPVGLDWSSPGKLARSLLVNSEKAKRDKTQRPLGHATIELRCSGSDGLPPYFLASGMTDNVTDQEQEDLLLRDEIGFGIVFYNFPGRLQHTQEVLEEIELQDRAGRQNYVAFQISPSTCRRLQTYATEYEQLGYGRFYGLANRPLYGEGAGCTAYATSFLEVAGLILPAFRDGWSDFRRIPMHLIGGPWNNNRKVSFTKLVLSPYTRWAKPDEPHMSIFFWDPDRMYRWIAETHEKLVKGTLGDIGLPVTAERKGSNYGLRFYAERVPTPEGPIWKKLQSQ